jgi:hypothetical protein
MEVADKPLVFIFGGTKPEDLGAWPQIFDSRDPRPARDQAKERYVHGGWRPMQGFKFDHRDCGLTWPGDPELHPIAAIPLPLRGEMALLYPHDWVVIAQIGGKEFEVSRMD